MLKISAIYLDKQKGFIPKKINLKCTMDSSFFSQKMPYFLLTLLVYMALILGSLFYISRSWRAQIGCILGLMYTTFCVSFSLFDAYNNILIQSWTIQAYTIHTGRFDSKFFPTFPNPIVNLDFHMNTDSGLSWVWNDM